MTTEQSLREERAKHERLLIIRNVCNKLRAEKYTQIRRKWETRKGSLL